MTTTHPQGTRGGAGQGFPGAEPGAPGTRRAGEPGGEAGRVPGPPPRPPRPLALTGAIAACAAAGAGLATLTLVAAIAWIAAVHVGLGAGLAGVLRTAVQLWLAAHHVGFDLHTAGKIGLLPLGLVLVPGAVLWRAGRWVVRRGGVQRLRHVGYATLALALPYGLLAGALAVASRTAASAPSPVQAAVAGFLLAFVAGGLGGARALAPWARLIGLLPDRARCLVVGVTGSLGALACAGALLTGASLVAHAHEFSLASDVLSPGLLGSALLLLAALSYLPNAIIWAMAYMLGPGFAFGVGTVVAPAGTLLGPLPVFPMLAALPAGSPGPHPAPTAWTGLAVLAVPYLAGAFGGLLTVRTAPTPTVEAAPLWGLASGVLTGGVLGALAMFSGGSLGTGRLATTGPVAWQIAVVAALELGVAAAITAGLANWLLLRRVSTAAAAAAGPGTLGDDPVSDTTDDITPDGVVLVDVAVDDAADDTAAADGVAMDDILVRDAEVADAVEDTVLDDGSMPDDDAGAVWVPALGAVTPEDLARLAESPGADASVPPILPAGGVADEFGYLPEPLEFADDPDDDEPAGPPAPVGIPDHVEPEDRLEPEDTAEPGDGGEDAPVLGHVIYLRPRDRDGGDAPAIQPEPGGGQDPDADRESTPDQSHDPDGESAGDSAPGLADDPGEQPGDDGLTGRAHPAAP